MSSHFFAVLRQAGISSVANPRKAAGGSVGADDDQSPIAVPERFQGLVHRLCIHIEDMQRSTLSGVAESSETGEGRHSPVITRPAPPISRLNCVEDHSLVQ